MSLMRSLLFMPGNKEKMLAKTPTVGADAVIWDLEDAVSPAEKPAARQLIHQYLKEQPLGLPIYVRTNAVSSGLIDADLQAVVSPNLRGIVLPKVEAADEIRYVSRTLVNLEQELGLPRSGIKIIALLETALGVIRAYEIATASERVEALSLGAEDFASDLGTSRSREGIELAHARGNIVLAAAAAKIMALDTVYSDLNDPDGLERECRLARQLGFSGKCAIHPKQVEIINKAFSPTEAELEYARKVVAAFEEAQAQNLGVIVVEGRMVDKPIVQRALRLLEKYGVEKCGK
ncbi:MAG: citrate lyase subunit beta / citryl-CoA lyase [Clostridia bacterium]|nr:citrate lyase subunit beta / citryl-CoA lyase [Clostridia bacterium]